MRFSTAAFAFAAALGSANAQLKGFNYGAFFLNQQAKQQADFAYEFNRAKTLPGTDGWTSARLYTMIQWGTTSDVISAIPAAIQTNTQLLLGMWASSGQDSFNNELTALKAAISQYGSSFTNLVVGISVGSEDLYRISPTGIENKSGAGANPADLVNYINQVRSAISGTGLQGKPIGHVDTWTAYVNATNNPVISAVDFVGVDAYPYFQTTMANSIGNANATFYDAYHQTVNAAQGKPVWVTETGWPVSGPQENQAVASTDNARVYWQDVACSLVANKVNLFWYDLQESQWGQASPDFGVYPAGDLGQLQPSYSLSCDQGAVETSSMVSLLSSTSTADLSSIMSGVESLSSVISTSLLTLSEPTITSTSLVIATETITVTSPTFVAETPMQTGLTGPYEVPHLIVPVDKSKPDQVSGNSYVAHVSTNAATLFNFDVPPSYAGKTCTLVFHVPASNPAYQMSSPGGILVFQLQKAATEYSTSNNAGEGNMVGGIVKLNQGQGQIANSGPCQAGQRVGYRVESLNGLDLQYFQMTDPPLGLFMTVS